MAVFRITVEYDGTGWHGWQSQPGAPTIQEAVETALATVMRTQIPIVGSGRTDAGVHATGQVAHFETDLSVSADALCGKLNGLLPRSVAVRDIQAVPDSFHARYGAVLRTYHYRVSTVPVAIDRTSRIFLRPAPDFRVMNTAAKQLLGEQNFSALCRTSSATSNRVCRLEQAEWIRADGQGGWNFVVSGDRFLHGMVRAMVGTLVEIGSGKRPPDDMRRVLATRDRREAGPAAPARGLVLREVTYPSDISAGNTESSTDSDLP